MPESDNLKAQVRRIIAQSWVIRDARSVPQTANVALAKGGVRLDAAFLYADLTQSSLLATELHQRTAAKVVKAYLFCMANLIKSNHGEVTSFDGDRVMGVFLGNSKETNATICALKMNYVVKRILGPSLEAHFTSLRDAGYRISHCVGVDKSNVLTVRAGQRGTNDLVWIGRAPNLAAKLSEIREDPYCSVISEEVYASLDDSAQIGGNPPQYIWESRTFQFLNSPISVYRSKWYWDLG